MVKSLSVHNDIRAFLNNNKLIKKINSQLLTITNS